MDNWGDPWADNADTTKSPTKSEVTSPLPPAFTPAPALLNGFLDDAGWGNDDGDFGDWSSATAEEEGADATRTETTITDAPTPRDPSHDANDAKWDLEAGSNIHVAHGPSDWAGLDMDRANDDEPVLSESSDTSTTVQANEIAEPIADEPSVPAQADDDTSTRTSTSPSETSHNDVPTESPRTSYEEEGADKRPVDVEPTEVSNRSTEGSVVGQDAGEAVLSSRTADSEERIEDESEDEVDEQVDMAEDDAASTSAQSSPASPSGGKAASGIITTGGERFEVDSDLMGQLFPAWKENTELAEAPEDPIFSISARKAWYRLTRKQTMREYNNGDDDDNYVRVNWASSSIRTEVNNVVGRWAREDRISGTGPGARASFYWDTPAPTESELNAMHARQRSSLSIASASASVQKESNAPALSSNAAVAFNWSSPTATSNPWPQDGPSTRSTSSQEGRAVSVDLTPRQPNAAKHARTLTTNVETPIAPSLVSPPIKNTSTVPTSLETWTGLDALDSTPAQKSDLVEAPLDDDDEWGEMVSTPTVSTPTTTEPPSVPALQNNGPPTSATTPQSAKSTSVQDQSPDTMHATPIVRLRSAISPTSALFKANSFVPMSVEQGPIGPGILKPVSRSSSSAIKKTEKPSTSVEPEPAPAPAPAPPPAPKEVANPSTLEDLWSSPGVQTPEKAMSRVSTPSLPVEPAIVAPARPSTPPLQVTTTAQSNIDPWADADFSFFESAPPAAPPRSKKDPPDQPTTLDSPRRSTSVASSTRTFSRSPPRKITPPPVQPLTGATNMAQRRKAEEDQIVELILRGLPDLGYMLQ